MEILNDEIVWEGKYIRTIRRHFKDRNGSACIWEMVDRKTHGPSALIAAVTSDKEIILEKIFRVPLRDYILELPAGLMDKSGESSESLARRELLEETGYAVGVLTLLTTTPMHPTFANGELSIFLGFDARKVAEPALEAAEEIEIIKVPVAELFDTLTTGEVKFDIKILALIPFLKVHGIL